MKPRDDRLLKITVLIVQAFRLANGLAVLCFVAALVATLPGAEPIEAALLRKYGAGFDATRGVHFLQMLMLLSLPVGYAIERLLLALRAMLHTVRIGEPFAATNAARLRTIGWMLLAIQLGDLGLGLATIVAASLRVEFIAWQPSFTGWIAVLVAFVLAQVFERGAAMQGDLEGTV